MQINLVRKITNQKIDCQVFFFFSDLSLEKQAKGLFLEKGMWAEVGKDFKGRVGSTQIIYLTTGGKAIFVGLGEKKKLDNFILRQAVQQAVMQATTRNVSSLVLDVENIPNINEQRLELISFSCVYGSYRFVWHKHEEKGEESKNLEQVYLLYRKQNKKLLDAVKRGLIIGFSTNSTRDLANHPANIATPTHLAKHAQDAAKRYGFSCKVLNEKEIKQERLGLIEGVGIGSEEPSKFIVLEYGDKKIKPIVMIGKGLTFDSGGISLKPGDKMEEMKFDMAGGATVLGLFEVLAKLKIKGHFVGLIPAVENMPSGKAMKPGDILTAQNGKTVEVINTDAEGRMVVADAICYARKHCDPALIMDFATLTGAILYALGDHYTGVFANTEKFNRSLARTSKDIAEALWFMPLAREYKNQMDSEVADIKNVGDRGAAGASTAALFLEYFVGDINWVHFDIAGTAWNTKPKYYQGLGATAWGLYLTLNFLRALK